MMKKKELDVEVLLNYKENHQHQPTIQEIQQVHRLLILLLRLSNNVLKLV